MASILSTRLIATRSLSRSLRTTIGARYVSQARQISDSELASFYSYLESHPPPEKLREFQKTPEYKDIIKHLQNEGATPEDIDSMVSPAAADEGMNGGYVNPPPIKRSLRDPYEDWWDKQERRNYGEPIHEDNDTLGIFSLEEYNVFTPAQAAKGGLIYIGGILSLCGLVYAFYPDKPTLPRTYPGGLDAELGGEGALAVAADVE